jgi:hypothetical protein
MAGVALVPHPATPSNAARFIVVHLRREPQVLALRYVLTGNLGQVRLPAPRPAARADGLWRHTCFEVFIAVDRSPAYQEFNFSPSSEWAAYALGGYRERSAPLDCDAPRIAVRASDTELELEARIVRAGPGRLRLGLSAVVEDAQGVLSYWALRHPSDRPDFHHADAFALEIDEIRH